VADFTWLVRLGVSAWTDEPLPETMLEMELMLLETLDRVP
jgi:hypothetical protein